MPAIRRLDDTTIDRIAAGEVVERPASVVKELVENSLDADADRIGIEIVDGGTERIRITDDGIGMSEDDLRIAVEQHTTSKIDDIDDLTAGVSTLGFRGEALHTIGAVSRLTITTKPRDGGDGTRLTMEGSEVTAVEPAGRPAGTTVEVRDLFYNTPARRKYLGTETTEFGHVNRVATRYALANPDVAVSLEHNDREVFATTGQGDLASTILSVYGKEVATSMLELDRTDLPPGPLDRVWGFVSHPETTRSAREYVSTFVNGRYVRDGDLRNAVLDGYGDQLANDRYPFAVLFLSVPGDTVDVNVHPRKMEVRFNESGLVKQQVTTAVEDALLEAGIIRSSAPRGKSAPDQATIEPSSAATDDTATKNDADADGTPMKDDADADGPETEPTTGTTNPTATVDPDEPTIGDTETGSSGDTAESEETASPSASSRSSSPSESSPSSPSATSPSQSSTDDTDERSSSRATADETASSSRPDSSRSSTPSGPQTQTTLSGEDAHPSTAYDNFPDLRVLGQLHDTYIVAEADDGLVLIDQHAADERINYERLWDRFEGDSTSQALADPVEIELTAREAALFEDFQDALAGVGFEATRVDDRTVEVTTVPGLVASAEGPSVIRDVLADLLEGEDAAADTVDAVADALLSDMACHPSITGNTSLTDGSVVDLLSALDDCENPWACPHGRPVLIQIDGDEIDDRFERDYPGH
jgi:DNA mismatch repair protein MutL